MRKILIPTDFSENAASALVYALDFINKEDAIFYIVNVIEPLPLAGYGIGSTMQVLVDQKQKVSKIIEETIILSKAIYPNKNIEYIPIIEVGNIVSTIQLKAKEKEVDLVILGTQGQNHNALEKYLGTVSTDVIKKAPCPIIMIPLDYRFKSIQKVVYCSNLDHADPFNLFKAINTLQTYTAVVHVIYAQTKNMDPKTENEILQLSEFMKNHPVSLQTRFHITDKQNVNNAIIDFADTYDVDMIMMHERSRSLWSNFVHPSKVKKMVRLTEKPLMVIN